MKTTVVAAVLAAALAAGAETSIPGGRPSGLDAAPAAAAAGLPLPDDVARAKAESVLARLTLEEKVTLLGGCHTMYVEALPEKGVPRRWALSDATHGIKPEHRRWDWGYEHGVDNRCTVLPCGSALAATWNVELAAAHGHVQGEQMRARGKDQMLGPGVNINRTPLCGRNWEYMGEDPHLAGRLAAEMIRAVQSHGVAATVKHFCLNNQEWNRIRVDTVVDERTLHEIYLPAFRAAIREGGALCVMTSFNKYNGAYLSENAYLQKNVLRERFGFLGQIVTDWGGTWSTERSANGGGNLEMDCGECIRYFLNPKEGRYPLAEAVRAGRVPEATVDAMARNQLFVMAKTGFLDGVQPKGRILAEEHRRTAQEIGEESVVLLKNDEGILPLAKERLRKVVVLGQQSAMLQCHLGCSTATKPGYEITPLAGLREYLGKQAEVTLLPLGDECVGGAFRPIPEGVLETCHTVPGVPLPVRAWKRYDSLAEEWAEPTVEPAYVDYPTGVVARTLWFVADVRAPETGVYRIGLEPRGRLHGASVFVGDTKVFELSSGNAAVTGIPLREGETYRIRVLLRGSRTADNIAFGWLMPSQIAAMDVDKDRIVAAADAVIVFTGSQLGWGRAHESEEYDLPDMREPGGHDEEIAALLKARPRNLVVVQRSGTQMLMPWAEECPTLVNVSYLGMEAGRSLARVLFGDANPSGRLVASWPRRYEETGVGAMGTYNPTNVIYNERFYVGYRWHDAKGVAPLFPFGYGLSYTRFDWSEATSAAVAPGVWEVSLDVANAGKVAGKEVVELYVAPVAPTVERVVKELKGFAKTRLLAPGESERVTLRVRARDLAYYDDFLHRWRAPKGRYRLLVSSSSAPADVRSAVEIELAEDRVFTVEEE